MLLTIVTPVNVHMTMVSQKTAVMEMTACLAGEESPEEPAAMAAVPMPASLVKSPLAIPNLAASKKVLPTNPPIAARPVKAEVRIRDKADDRKRRFCHNKKRQEII